uniref:Knottin scorpion toxin-like domain-containing protein n=1 Tax=Aegilops tauschii subsp. strangulata TaxID=200361 RepID=A0A453JNW9_AEGTS
MLLFKCCPYFTVGSEGPCRRLSKTYPTAQCKGDQCTEHCEHEGYPYAECDTDHQYPELSYCACFFPC